MKKHVAKFLTLTLVLTSVFVSSPSPMKVDVVSAATGESTTPTTTTPTKPTTPSKTTTTSSTNVVVKDGDQVYTVVKGDMLWKIAKKFNLTLDQLLALNPQIKNKNLIFAGQKIIVGQKAETVATAPVTKYYHGFGEVANYRIRGEKKDNLNLTTASVIFDQDGKIVSLTWDVMEVTYTLFPGWVDPNAEKSVKDEFKASIDNKWETKREELDEYGMKKSAVSGKEWWEQLDYYESFFKGMTVAEVEAWVEKYTDASKKPYKLAYPEKLTDADKAAIANFTDKEKEMLVDVTTSATMSLQDDHSFFISALKEAYEARKEIK